MRLSSWTWHCRFRHDATVGPIEQRSGRAIRLATVGVALVVAGLVAPGATQADEAAFDPPTQNERSIMLIESKEPSGDTAFVPMTASQRSIAMTESKEAPGGVLAGGQPDFAQTANGRSIAMTESKEAPGGVLAGGVPDTVESGDR